MVQKQGTVNCKRIAWLIILMLEVLASEAEEVVELEPLVVEGWHFDELAMALPMGVKRIDREEIAGSGWRTVPELLERVAGIRFTDTTGNGTTGQLSLRGFGDNSGLRVLILVDGQVYNPPDMGGIDWGGIDLEQLETVEVLRGGQTVLYGNHAVAGVIKLSTRRAGQGIAGNVVLGAGSDELLSFRAATTIRTGKAGAGGGASWMRTGGYRKHASFSAESGYISWSWEEPELTGWSGRVHYSATAMELPGPVAYEEMLEDPRESRDGVDDQVDGRTYQFTTQGEGTTDWGAWELAAGLLNRQRQWNLDGLAADNRLRRITLNPRLKTMTGGSSLIAGADLAWDQVGHTGYWDETRETAISEADIERLTMGGYLFVNMDLAPNLALSGGMRIEAADTNNEYLEYRRDQLFPEIKTNRGVIPNPHYKNPPDADPGLSFSGPVDKSGWAAELSVLCKASDQISLWAGWDRVYRYPTLDETAAYQGYPLSDPLNENLDPETGNNFELGAKASSINWYFGLTAYFLMLDNEISFVEYNNGGTTVRLNDNVGHSERKGIEMDISYQKERYGLSLIGSVVDVSLEREGIAANMPLVPDKEANLVLWIKPLRKLKVQLQQRFQSSQIQGNDFAAEFRKVPGFQLTSVRLHWEFNEQCSLVLGINNLFDKTYAVTAYSGGFYPGAGRQLYLTARMNF